MAKAITELTTKQLDKELTRRRREYGRTGSMASIIRMEEAEAEVARRADLPATVL